MSASTENKAIAQHAWKAFGGTPKVRAYQHDTEAISVDVLRCDNRPYNGVTSYSTIGVSDTRIIGLDGSECHVRIEIAGSCATSSELYPNVLASAAFCIMRTRRFYGPGSAMLGYVREYYPSTTVPHLYFTAPFLWESRIKTLQCGTKVVSWVLAVPISDAEHDYLQGFGDHALEELFEKHQIDIFDLDRVSVAP